jgi:hypothetical protein
LRDLIRHPGGSALGNPGPKLWGKFESFQLDDSVVYEDGVLDTYDVRLEIGHPGTHAVQSWDDDPIGMSSSRQSRCDIGMGIEVPVGDSSGRLSERVDRYHVVAARGGEPIAQDRGEHEEPSWKAGIGWLTIGGKVIQVDGEDGHPRPWRRVGGCRHTEE